MSTTPPRNTPADSRHILRNRLSDREAVFEWTGTAWSTPGTRWATKPAGMSAAGWRYVGPEPAAAAQEAQP